MRYRNKLLERFQDGRDDTCLGISALALIDGCYFEKQRYRDSIPILDTQPTKLKTLIHQKHVYECSQQHYTNSRKVESPNDEWINKR